MSFALRFHDKDVRLPEVMRSGYRSAVLLAAAFVACEQQAHAYTDPGSGALIWQVAVAGFVGGLFYVRRIKTYLTGLIKRR
jgi:hypothetical protein